MYTLLLLAGGKGTRMQNEIPKQFLLLAGKPIILHTLEKIEKIEEIEEIVIVCEKQYIKQIDEYRKNYRLNKKVRYADAGKTRQESVYNGLKLVKTKDVVIHEAARPLVTKNEFEKLLLCEERNVTYTYPIPYTVLLMENECISGMLNRDELVNIQLPQKFETSLLIDAHRRADKEEKKFTEDASLLYYYCKEKVRTIKGSQYNLKITEPLDLILAEYLYKENLIRKED